MARWGEWGWYPKSSPRRAEGGIKAANKRGQFGESWWAKRWIDVLESFHIGSRLTRGRSYARQGQVLSVLVDKGRVTSKVQGSRPRPYEVEISVKPLPAKEWAKFVEAISSQAIFAAKLLAGEMPRDIESAFKEQGLSLFPSSLRDIETDCSCPDWSNPCKHIAAVYYLLGEEFDRDPFLIFRLRGMGRDEIAEALGNIKGPDEPEEKLEPSPLAVEGFWTQPGAITGRFEMTAPAMDAAIVRRLGRLPFWAGEPEMTEALAPVYQAASRRALSWSSGEAKS